jgi:hypothetical protein
LISPEESREEDTRMKLRIQLRSAVCFLIAVMLLIQVFGCGTIFYPERRGQKSGRIDPGIAILDGIGLLFFIIPGLVAYGIDFTTGAIYLPGGPRSSDLMRVVYVSPRELNEEKIREILVREAGCPEDISLESADVYVVEGPEKIPGMLAHAASAGFHSL